MASLPELLYWADKAPQYFWIVTAAAVAHPYTRTKGLQMASFGIRATARMGFASVRALSTTTLIRGGSITLGGGIARATGAVAAGYVIGAGIGYGISRLAWGDQGGRDAIAVYTGQVSRQEYLRTVRTGLATLY